MSRGELLDFLYKALERFDDTNPVIAHDILDILESAGLRVCEEQPDGSYKPISEEAT